MYWRVLMLMLSLWSCLISSEAALSSSTRKNQVPEWLPHCFRLRPDDDNTSVTSTTRTVVPVEERVRLTLRCIERNLDPVCYDEEEGESFEDIVDCIDETLPPVEEIEFGGGNFARLFHNATRACLNPYADCANFTIQDRIDILPPCVNGTLRQFARCVRRNRPTCRRECAGTQRPASNPFEDLLATQLMTCNGIQSNLMMPMCDIINCCEPCIPQFENVMNCLVNRVLDNTFDECPLECPANIQNDTDSGGNRELRATNGRTLQEDSSSLPTDAMDVGDSVCLQYSPGLTGTDSLELEARSGIFLPCIYDEFFSIMENVDTSPTATPPTEEALGDPTSTAKGYPSCPWMLVLKMCGVLTLALLF